VNRRKDDDQPERSPEVQEVVDKWFSDDEDGTEPPKGKKDKTDRRKK